jgi:VanZ family protein
MELRRTLSLWAPVVLLMGAIFYVSSLSDPGEIPGGATDKQAHALVYGLLSALMVRALAGGTLAGTTGRRAITGALLATAYGASDEWHQSFVPGREAEVADVVANAAGAFAAAGALWAWSIIRATRGASPPRAGRGRSAAGRSDPRRPGPRTPDRS